MSAMFQDASDNGHTKKENDGPLSVDHLPSILNAESPLPSLQIRTDLPSIRPSSSRDSDPYASTSLSGSYPRRTPSLRALFALSIQSAGSLSPASFISSPQLNAMGDITPLPSPIGGAVPWRRADVPSLSRSSSMASRNGSSIRLSDSSQMLGPPVMSRSRPKPYTGIDGQREDPSEKNGPCHDSPSKHSHSRNRSLSDYAPPGRVSVPPRPIAVSGSNALGIASSSSIDSKSNGLHREQHLAVHRGITLPTVRPPQPTSQQWQYADEDEEWDPEKGKGLEGARDCVEGLLKRNTKRKSLDEIAAMDWVRDAIDVPGGLKRGDKEVP
ncbi:uncharacterized protein N7500_005812 [Penicillium coprophilum]|uniref:uncharacterized protein n=1 Tax=Penicillium coprophilum TaxID=36646 RepID=UPI002388F4D7|nr:uncharacterized protein N7500_005812 [Penicillium coprophilum]KAJ5163982.1 hypothetical protein N7500_005812 [Penicillium coprophilum]